MGKGQGRLCREDPDLTVFPLGGATFICFQAHLLQKWVTMANTKASHPQPSHFLRVRDP